MTSSTLERTFDALANEHRREIVVHLGSGPMEAPALGSHFAMSKQALNRHLTVLESAGLVERRRRGRVSQIQLRLDPFDGVDEWLGSIRSAWESSFDRLGDVLVVGDPSAVAASGEEAER